MSSTPGSDVPDAPQVLAQEFSDYLAVLNRYAYWLAGAGVVRGLVGPREVSRIWDRHVLNSLALSELIPSQARLVDVGSGAGLPGLAIACVRPDLRVDLVEPLLRRTTFLNEVVTDLGLANRVRVLRGRADDPAIIALAGRAQYVTARAVAPLDRLVRWCTPLLARGGNLLAIKGRTAESELEAHRAVIAGLGADIVGTVECGTGLVDPLVTVVHLRRR